MSSNLVSGYKRLPAIAAWLLACVLCSSCAAAWVTPSPEAGASTPVVRSTVAKEPTAAVRAPLQTATPQDPLPQPVSQSSDLIINDEPVQAWTDPNDVNALLYDEPYLWAATSGGVVRWHPLTGDYCVFTAEDGLASPAVRGIAQDADGHIWVGYTGSGAWSEYDGVTWHTYESREEAVEARYAALLLPRQTDARLWASRPESGWIWLPTADGRVESFNGQEWRVYGTGQGVRSNTQAVAVCDSGRVWAIGDGLSTAEEGEVVWDDHALFSGIADPAEVTSLAADDACGLWLGYASSAGIEGGVARYDLESNRWIGYPHAINRLIPRQVYAVKISTDGMVWLCGEGGISWQYPNGLWDAVSIGDVTARCFAAEGEVRYWVGTSHGIWSVRTDGTQLQGPWLVPSPMVGNQVASLNLDAQGQLWIATPKGAYAVGRSGGTYAATQEHVYALAVQEDGSVWLAGESGLLLNEIEGNLSVVLEQSIRALALDGHGTLWALAADGTLYRREGAEWTQVAALAEQIPGTIRALAVDSSGAVWLATAVGLAQLAPDGTLALLGVDEGLPNSDVRCLAVGADDTLWVGTANGLARREPSGRWTRFTSESTEGGLRSAEIRALYLDREGTLWLATAAGLSERTANADWAFYDLPDARVICYDPKAQAVWVGTSTGLYRIRADSLQPVP